MDTNPSFSLTEMHHCEIPSRVSNVIFMNVKENNEKVIISDWNGNIHIFQTYRRLRQLKGGIKIFSSPVLSMAVDRKGGDVLFLGSAEGELASYEINKDKLTVLDKDEEKRPIAKIISVNDSKIFTFTWKRTKCYFDYTKENFNYQHKLLENFITAEYVAPYIVVLFGNNSIAFINSETYQRGNSFKYKALGFDTQVKSFTCFNQSIEYIAFGDIQGGVKVFKKESKDDSLDLKFYNSEQFSDYYTLIFDSVAHFQKMDKQIFFPVHAIDFHPEKWFIILTGGGDNSLDLLDLKNENGSQAKRYVSGSGQEIFTQPFSFVKFLGSGESILTVETTPLYDLKNMKMDMLKSTVRMFSINPSQ